MTASRATSGLEQPATPVRTRDRDATTRMILDSAKAVLAEEGFRKFGINGVARRAGCDKQLIYRYFGGVDGLIDAIGTDLASWVGDRLGLVSEVHAPASYAELVERLIIAFAEALKGDMLVQKIIAWEIAEPSDRIAKLAEARSRSLAAWTKSARGALVPPSHVDVGAVIAVLIAAVQHLVLARAISGHFAGVRLLDDVDWNRIVIVLRRMIQALLVEPAQ